MRVLESCRVSLPPDSAAEKTLTLTFFDLIWLYLPRPSRLFFYEFPHPSNHFTTTILPKLKHSLSLALQIFYPFAGSLTWSPSSAEPQIRCVDGDSVSLTVAESTADVNHLSGNHARYANQFSPLVPCLPSLLDSDIAPVLALQVTVFPNSGFCIGITSSHVVADGRSLFHFIRSWASICSLGGDLSPLSGSLPFYDRTVIKDPDGLLKKIYLQEIAGFKFVVSSSEQGAELPVERLQATFLVNRTDVDRLKQWLLAHCNDNETQIQKSPLPFSTFVVICALTWVCLIKVGAVKSSPTKTMEHFVVSADCRGRLVDPPVPTTYFGNCVTLCFAKANRGDLIGERGFPIAAKAIADAIRRLEDGVLNGAERWISESGSLVEEGAVTVAGSPRFGAYEADFGWGRPKKHEVVGKGEGHFSFYDGSDGEGAVEVGLALSKPKMDAFATLFVNGLNVARRIHDRTVMV
ncbi:PREDICTED: malonyl-coenzyme A:anthocyanin 3-O-glucoside-6''-O-malonyltransferase-like [Nelumbo nucifera]|uniref:Malonyl-coenzyme A:anthocyanin 3-O-glucoside-6''-O-malonyltransferase-like n=2 Tax=Nelumbo nucifera TaxID=4432 RepID=A0A1U8A1W8_NELNU|nr:PREDICTED: malonyl-coenzyme A:anthocyanin 3-O-glucoside-6''-O-malonyltransferase-like [Nelumbo nucifera]DAD40105.1 TPA_asm: hypothetical protein HUJ06_014428 [Nelumbo nucifera]